MFIASKGGQGSKSIGAMWVEAIHHLKQIYLDGGLNKSVT
jgi:hypothetical protein